MTSRTRQIAALASTVVLALGVSACGGSDDTPAAKASASATAGSGSSSPSSGDAAPAAFFQDITDAQVKAGTSHVSMKIGAAGQTITAEGDIKVGSTAADTSMRMTMDLGSTGMGNLSMVLVDKIFYLDFGQVTGGKYAKVDLDDASNPIAKQFGSITDQLDPSEQLAQFKDALSSFEKKGSPETIDGVKAQPYELTLDTSKVTGLADLPSGSDVPKSLTYAMYIGPDDLLRRITADVAGSTIKVDYSKWGEPVDVKAPSAAEISDVDLGQLAGS